MYLYVDRQADIYIYIYIYICIYIYIYIYIPAIKSNGSNGLYCVIKLYEGEKLLFFSLLASSLEMFLTSGNCFSALLGL